MSWTDDMVAALKRHYIEEGRSASAAARLIGQGVSRNAVIGKAHRLGLERSEEVNDQNRGRRAPAARPAKAAKPALFSTEAWTPGIIRPPTRIRSVDDASNLVPLAGLRPHMCRWPIGDPLTEGFGFCGAAKAASGSYCGRHRARATIPTSSVEELERALGWVA